MVYINGANAVDCATSRSTAIAISKSTIGISHNFLFNFKNAYISFKKSIEI